MCLEYFYLNLTYFYRTYIALFYPNPRSNPKLFKTQVEFNLIRESKQS